MSLPQTPNPNNQKITTTSDDSEMDPHEDARLATLREMVAQSPFLEAQLRNYISPEPLATAAVDMNSPRAVQKDEVVMDDEDARNPEISSQGYVLASFNDVEESALGDDFVLLDAQDYREASPVDWEDVSSACTNTATAATGTHQGSRNRLQKKPRTRNRSSLSTIQEDWERLSKQSHEEMNGTPAMSYLKEESERQMQEQERRLEEAASKKRIEKRMQDPEFRKAQNERRKQQTEINRKMANFQRISGRGAGSGVVYEQQGVWAKVGKWLQKG